MALAWTEYFPCIQISITIAKNYSMPSIATYGWNLLWQLNLLGDCNRALLDRALHINIFYLLAEIGLSAEKLDETIFHYNIDDSVVLDGNVPTQSPGSLDKQRLASVDRLACTTANLLWRIRTL